MAEPAQLPIADVARLSVRLPLFLLFLLVSVVTLLVLRAVDLFRPRPVDRAPVACLYLKVLCRLLGISLRQHGVPISKAALFVSNHVSWVDIVVLGACRPILFLSKAEVARWPVIGWIAKAIGTLFIERSAGRGNEVKTKICASLRGGAQVLVFPEGTTTDGRTVLPFRRPLLGAAQDAGCPLQAISLCYLRDNEPDQIVPFVGNDSFQAHLVRLLSKPAVEVVVVFHEPVRRSELTGKRLASHLEDQVALGLRMIQTVSAGSSLAPGDPRHHLSDGRIR